METENDIDQPAQLTETVTEVPITPVEREEPIDQPATSGRPPRRERKEQYFQETQAKARERDQYAADLATERAERQRLATEVAEMRGRQTAYEAQSRAPAVDPTDARISELEAKANGHLRALQTQGVTPEVAERELAAWHKTQREITATVVRAEQAKAPQQQGFDPGQVAAAAFRQAIEADFPWIATNEDARDDATLIERKLWRQGKPKNMATTREACAMAAREHKLGGGSAPSASAQDRRRFAIPSGREGGTAEAGQRTVPMNANLKKMAEARYPQLEAEEAHRKWASDIGQKVFAEKA